MYCCLVLWWMKGFVGGYVCQNIYQSMNKIVESISKVEVEWQKSRAIFVLISLLLLYGGDYEIV